MRMECAAAACSNSSDSSSCSMASSAGWNGPSSRGRAKCERPRKFQVQQGVGRRPGTSGHGGATVQGTKGYVGVRQRHPGRWVAEIKDTKQNFRLWLGTFDTPEDAARAYDEAAWLLRGANTRTNFVGPGKRIKSALPSKAARQLLEHKNAAAAAAQSSNPGSSIISKSSTESLQQTLSLSDSLIATATSAAPQQTTPRSGDSLPPAAPRPGPKSLHQQHAEINNCCAAPMASSISTTSGSAAPRSHFPYCCSLGNVESDLNSSATRGGRSYSINCMDHMSLQAERSQLVPGFNTRMVTQEMCGVEWMPPQVAVTYEPWPGLSCNNNSCRAFPMTGEMYSSEISMHQTAPLRAVADREISYTSCSDGIGENLWELFCNEVLQVQGTAPAQDHNSTAAMAHHNNFDIDIRSTVTVLSGLEDVTCMGCVDSVDYSSSHTDFSQFDFSFSEIMEIIACADSVDSDPCGINLGSSMLEQVPTFPAAAFGTGGAGSSEAAVSPARGGDEDHDTVSNYEGQHSARLYATKGLQECLMLPNNSTPAPSCMSSPCLSISLPPSFRRSLSGSIKNNNVAVSQSQGWLQEQSDSNTGSIEYSRLMNSNINLTNSNSGGKFSSGHQSDHSTTLSVSNSDEPTHGSSESQQMVMNFAGSNYPSPPEVMWLIPVLSPVAM